MATVSFAREEAGVGDCAVVGAVCFGGSGCLAGTAAGLETAGAGDGLVRAVSSLATFSSGVADPSMAANTTGATIPITMLTPKVTSTLRAFP